MSNDEIEKNNQFQIKKYWKKLESTRVNSTK
jgi:hypothetical protein